MNQETDTIQYYIPETYIQSVWLGILNVGCGSCNNPSSCAALSYLTIDGSTVDSSFISSTTNGQECFRYLQSSRLPIS